jgi:uncharacterized protein YdcH (DUF465 family)
MNYDSLEAHLDELVKKHRKLDEEVEQLSTHHVSAELRQLKTQKLWLKDEIYRIQKQLKGSNGHG